MCKLYSTQSPFSSLRSTCRCMLGAFIDIRRDNWTGPLSNRGGYDEIIVNLLINYVLVKITKSDLPTKCNFNYEGT